MSDESSLMLPWTQIGTSVYFADVTGGFDLRDCPDPEVKAKRIVTCLNTLAGIDEPKAAPQEAPELLPCPFCGTEAKYRPDHTTEKCDSVWCTKCDCHVSDFNLTTQSDCISAWNTRTAVSDAALAKARDDALEEVEELIAMTEEDCSAPMVRSFDEAFSAACQHIKREVRALKGKTDE